MSRTVTGVVIAAIAIIVVGAIVLVGNNRDGNPTTSQTEEVTVDANRTQETTQPEQQTSVTQQGQAVEVDIVNMSYQPDTIQIKKGTTVTWTNQDSIRHDVTPDEESPNFEGSQLLSRGDSYSYTFDTVGTYTYHCTPHPQMTGSVEVVE